MVENLYSNSSTDYRLRMYIYSANFEFASDSTVSASSTVTFTSDTLCTHIDFSETDDDGDSIYTVAHALQRVRGSITGYTTTNQSSGGLIIKVSMINDSSSAKSLTGVTRVLVFMSLKAISQGYWY